MREKNTWCDEEFKKVARELYQKYPHLLSRNLDVDKIFFMRTSDVEPRWVSKIRKCGHPWGSMPGLEEIIYVVETADAHWKRLNQAQRVLVVFHELKHIPDDGCDMEHDNRGKIIDHPIQDFPECVAAANGNLFWGSPGQEIPNILETSPNFDLEQALKRVGLMVDAETKRVKYPPSGVERTIKKEKLKSKEELAELANDDVEVEEA